MTLPGRNNPHFEQNERLADQINEEAMRDAESPYAGKIVGIANGKVVAIGDNRDDVVKRLRQIEPDSMKCYCFEAGVDYTRVVEIWSQF